MSLSFHPHAYMDKGPNEFGAIIEDRGWASALGNPLLRQKIPVITMTTCKVQVILLPPICDEYTHVPICMDTLNS